MATRRKRETIEQPSGLGKVFKGTEYLADVAYALRVEQEFLVWPSRSGSQVAPGLKNITGEITVVRGERDLINNEGPFTLHLDDGRKWEFHVRLGDPVSATYGAINAGAGGLFES